MWKPFSGYKIHAVISANGGRQIVLSTRSVRDELNNNQTPPEGKIFVWDVEAQKLVRDIVPVAGQKKAGPIIEARPGVVLGLTGDPAKSGCGIVYEAEIATGKVLFNRPVPRDCDYAWSNGVSDNDLTRGPDGNGYTFMGDVLVRLHASDGRVEALGRVKGQGRITFVGKNIYLTGRPELRRIKGVIQ
jgi:hypothetical protein